MDALRAFNDLSFGFCSEEVVARLIHCLEVFNLRTNKATGLELIFIDKKGKTIHGLVSEEHVVQYKPMLLTNSIYKLNQFLVVPSRIVYKVSSNCFSIQFTAYTILQATNSSRYAIEEQQIRIRNFEELSQIADANGDLFGKEHYTYYP
ncbi:unnamed protein product [Cochlearia groenlandica]